VADNEHQRGEKKGKFCATPGAPPCECGNNYRTVCEPGWSARAVFTRIINFATGPAPVEKGYEAHHVLCVSSVNEAIFGKKGIQKIIRETEWCINAKGNMLGMPLWGHTVMWYTFEGHIRPPGWEDIPQHDWDHNCATGYTEEVTGELKGLADDIEEAKDNHEADADNIAGALRNLSKSFKERLQSRGQRHGGTHQCWKLAQKDPDAEWSWPFSMASTASRKGFPLRGQDERPWTWIQRLAEAMF
jgi:hypothetical protein